MYKQIYKAKLQQALGRSKILRSKLQAKRRSDHLFGRINIVIGRFREKYWKSRLGATRLINRHIKTINSKSIFRKIGTTNK